MRIGGSFTAASTASISSVSLPFLSARTRRHSAILSPCSFHPQRGNKGKRGKGRASLNCHWLAAPDAKMKTAPPSRLTRPAHTSRPRDLQAQARSHLHVGRALREPRNSPPPQGGVRAGGGEKRSRQTALSSGKHRPRSETARTAGFPHHRIRAGAS